MAGQTKELSSAQRLTIALLLTLVGGYVDAFGYIALFQIFTANMSGNSIHVGMSAGAFDFLALLRPLCAISSYVAGLILARIALNSAARLAIARIASFTLGLEALLLIFFSQSSPSLHLGQIADLAAPSYFVLVGLLALAMGLQAATLTHVGPLTIYTTFVTGTLAKFSEAFTRVLFWTYDQLKAGRGLTRIARDSPKQKDVRDTTTLAAVWISYVAGAAMGTAAKQRWEFRSLYLPILLILSLVVVDRFRPIALQEEQSQQGL